MKRQTWFLLLLAAAARCLSLFVLNTDPYYRLVPRSLTGGGVLVQPGWLDLAVPLVFVVILWTSKPTERLTAKSLGQGALDALWILAFPLLTGLALFLYVQRWLVTPTLNGATLLHWIQFALAFVAINMFMDSVSVNNRWARRGLALLLTGALALTQDVMFGADAALAQIVAVLSSPGVLLAITALALRRVYRQSPWRGTLAAVLVGGITCFLVVAVRSESWLTLLVPALALLIGAFAMRSASPWPRRVALGGSLAIGLLLSLLLPRLVPPEPASHLAEDSLTSAHTETAGTLTISYDDPRVRDVAVRLAHVLEAANEVSRETFGVSPEIKYLTIDGIAPGGFYAGFPNSVTGNLPSERAAKLWLDEASLNAPDRSIHDLDPVNAILHEYSHLYGTVPYMPWLMGPEEEGWATYAATRVSLRLFEKYGAGLWEPPYDYARLARAITASNLQGHPVVWSHPDEFGGFRLWYALGERDGEEALFRKRWDLTQREEQRFLLMTSNPGAARRLAGGFGETDFASFGKAEPVRFADAISLEAYLRLAEMLDIPPDQMKASYARRANLLIRPGVRVPRSAGIWDGVVALGVLAVGIAARRRQHPSLA
jgi:hypothetical protein